MVFGFSYIIRIRTINQPLVSEWIDFFMLFEVCFWREKTFSRIYIFWSSLFCISNDR